MSTTGWGYQEAEKIDSQINALLEQKPIDKDNLMDWLNFTRTITTSLKLIASKTEDVLAIPKRRWDDE